VQSIHLKQGSLGWYPLAISMGSVAQQSGSAHQIGLEICMESPLEYQGDATVMTHIDIVGVCVCVTLLQSDTIVPE